MFWRPCQCNTDQGSFFSFILFILIKELCSAKVCSQNWTLIISSVHCSSEILTLKILLFCDFIPWNRIDQWIDCVCVVLGRKYQRRVGSSYRIFSLLHWDIYKTHGRLCLFLMSFITVTTTLKHVVHKMLCYTSLQNCRYFF